LLFCSWSFLIWVLPIAAMAFWYLAAAAAAAAAAAGVFKFLCGHKSNFSSHGDQHAGKVNIHGL